MRALIPLLVSMMSGCTPTSESAPVLQREAVAAQRPRPAYIAFTTSLPSGELLEVRTPDSLLPDDREFDRRCLIYRDHELRAVTMSCLTEPGSSE